MYLYVCMCIYIKIKTLIAFITEERKDGNTRKYINGIEDNEIVKRAKDENWYMEIKEDLQ